MIIRVQLSPMFLECVLLLEAINMMIQMAFLSGMSLCCEFERNVCFKNTMKEGHSRNFLESFLSFATQFMFKFDPVWPIYVQVSCMYHGPCYMALHGPLKCYRLMNEIRAILDFLQSFQDFIYLVRTIFT